jgi:hypothetical protein
MDSGFTIGISQNVGIRYLKQMKERATPKIYHNGNVIVCQIEKTNSLLQFVFLDFSDELEHLKVVTQDDKDSLKNSIIEIKENYPNLSLREISEKVGASNHMTVKRILDKL